MILTTEEFEARKDQVLLAFAEAWKQDMDQSVWLVAKKKKKRDAKLLWLCVFALNNYAHTAFADNFITEIQVMHIFSKVNSIE